MLQLAFLTAVVRMSSEMLRELFRSLENTIRQRMDVIEDIIRVSKTNTNKTENVAPTVDLTPIHKTLQEHEITMNAIQSSITNLTEAIADLKISRMVTKAVDLPVEAIEAELEVEMAEQEALNDDASEVEVAARSALAKVVNKLPVQSIARPTPAESSDDEDEEEEEEDEEEVEEEVEEEEEEEVVEEVELEEFVFNKKTYHRDNDNNVYVADEDGCIGDPIGTWDPVKKRILRG